MAKEFRFDEKLCAALDFLSPLEPSLVHECCAISRGLFDQDKYLSPKKLAKAASKLKCDPEFLSKCLMALASLFLKASKLSRSAKRLNASLELLGIPHSEIISDCWINDVHPIIRSKLDAVPDIFKHIQDTDWKIDVIVHTRARLVMKPEPLVTMRIKLADGEVIGFEAGPKQIVELSAQLDQALKCLKGKEARKYKKYL